MGEEVAKQLLTRSSTEGGGGAVVRVAPQLLPLCARQGEMTHTIPSPPSYPPLGDVAAPRLRVISAGYTVARRSRRGIFQLTHEGASLIAPYSRGVRSLSLSPQDGRSLLAARGGTLCFGELSSSTAKAASMLPYGPILLLFHAEDSSDVVPMPGRRLRKSDRIQLHLPFSPGLEFRPKAITHALSFRLGLQTPAS